MTESFPTGGERILDVRKVGVAIALSVTVAVGASLHSTVFVVAVDDLPLWLIATWLLAGSIASGLAHVTSRLTLLVAAVLLAMVAALDYVDVFQRLVPVASSRLSRDPVMWLAIGIFGGSALFKGPPFGPDGPNRE